jgi:hypothetical protein
MSDFLICVDNKSNPASPIVDKVYRRLPDPEAEVHDMLRVIDEDTSEPDGFLYRAAMFAPQRSAGAGPAGAGAIAGERSKDAA